MPLAKPLPELRRELEQHLVEDLPTAINALKTLLPEGSEKYRLLSTLLARLNDANKERFRNTISMEEYQRRCDQVRADFFDLLPMLEESDFDPQTSKAKSDNKPATKTGSVLYRIPDVMPIRKATRCVIRVAIDEESLLDNILLDEHVQVKSKIEVSDVMSAELLDPDDGAFRITTMNARTQLVRDGGYTEWLFSVTPLREGVHQLLVKVSIMEVVPGFPEPVPRDVSVLETVTIVTEGVAPEEAEDAPMKTAGLSLAFSGGNPNQAVFGGKPTEPPSRVPAPGIPGSVLAQGGRKFIALLAMAVIGTIGALFIVPKLTAPPVPPPTTVEKPALDTSDVGNENPTSQPQDVIQDTAALKSQQENGNLLTTEALPATKKIPANIPGKPADFEKPKIAAKTPRRSGFDMAVVEGGKFEMGQRDTSIEGTGFSKDECPHTVTVASFRIGKYEVTQADWVEVMGENPSYNKGCDECPVERVSWNDVQRFIKKANEKFNMNYRLPTEEEWEFAARGGNLSKGYVYAGSNNPYEVTGFDRITHLVGQKKPNELGLYDMSGNVYEWCANLYQPYKGCEGKSEEKRRVLRGGSWKDAKEKCRTTNRIHGDPTLLVNDFGFRLARD